jgi:type VII secretion protein EccB
MASRSEELRAYRFAMRRLLGAVVSHRSDAAVPQMRRAGGAIGAGIAIAVLSLGIVAAIGLISPKAPDWRRSDAVIVEKETGARFVYLDGVLHPVLNYTSARLIVGGAGAATVSVSHADLAAAPRGTPLGIPGAPDSLPAASDLLAGGWSVCTDADASNATVIGGGASGGKSLGGEAVYAQTSNGDQYLVWHNRRYLIADPRVIVPVPLKGAGTPRPIPDVIINSLPPGSDLKAIPIDQGHLSAVENLSTGTVVFTGDSPDARIYGLVRPHDIAIITALQKDILGDEGTGQPVQVDQQTFDGAAPSIGVGADWPPRAPAFARPDASLCVGLMASGAVSSVSVGATVGKGGTGLPAGESRLVVPGGRAALVRAAAAPGSTGNVAAAPTYLLTDDGERFPIADSDALASLGYASAKVLTLPSDVVDTLPTGVVLSRAAAQKAAGS